jgi:DNA (cytosine-5)-methyltransferase 1
MNYYNEICPKAAAWLRELINAGLIPNGDVDERSITELQPNELCGYTHCHFFAGIGGWSLALQLAGWPADRPVWTGSCPCQPFSAAGKGLGDKDERHLWPVFFDLIRQCRPECVFGEQVASAIGKGWLDGVSSDLESEGYACGSTVLGAHSVSAPHIRQRLYWMVNPIEQGLQGQHRPTDVELHGGERSERSTGPTGFWDQYDIIPCRDGKSRRIECQSRRLADGISTLVDSVRDTGATEEQIEAAINPFPLVKKQLGRTILLKGYGNAIVPQVAAEFIKAFLES